MSYKRISAQPVVEGGTGISTTTAYSVICAGTTATGAFQSLAALGSSGNVLASNGAGALPSFQALSGLSLGTTNHAVQIGNSSGTLTSLAVGSTGQTIMGSTGADPAFTGSPSFSGSVTAGTTITATSGAITATSGNVVLTSGNLVLTAASSSTASSITQQGFRLMHTFATGGITDGNLFIGKEAGNYTCGGATFNTAVGYQALKAVTGVVNNDNTAIGTNSLTLLTSGIENVGCGAFSFSQLATGSYNTALGLGAANAYTGAESSNICIGNRVSGTLGESNNLRIGSGTGTGNGQINVATICGITGKTSTSGIAVLVNSSNVLGTTTSSARFKDNIQDMGDQSSAIYKLRPVTFNYKVSKPHVDEQDATLRQFGLIAEEVEKVMPDQVNYNKDGQIESVRYLNLIPMLLNEIQKLRRDLNALNEHCRSMHELHD